MNYREIKTEEQLQEILSTEPDKPLKKVAFTGLDLSKHEQEVLQHDYDSCIFLGCKMAHGLKRKLTNSLVFPNMGELFQFRSTLYTAENLYDEYKIGDYASMKQCYDQKVYKHYLARGKQATDIKETLARTLHDHSISNALHEFLSHYREEDIVGVMGGHQISRCDAQYEAVAHISKRLTEAGKLMISGGGPGAMEATHLGAWMAGRNDEEMKDALNILAQAPTFSNPAWLDAAMIVRDKYPQTHFHSVGIPTWLYGHEPATPFATDIAKYFDNSIREDGILTIAKGGIIYTPGSAGTLQEIFQEAVQNHYLTYGYASPMVFMNRYYWMEEVPIFPLIADLIKRGKYKNLIVSISDDEQTVADEILKFHPSNEQI